MASKFRSAIEEVKAYIVANTQYTDDTVTFNEPNMETEEMNVCLYLYGFELPQLPKPGLPRSVYLKVEVRQRVDVAKNQDPSTVIQYEDVLEQASDLSDKLRRAVISGSSLTPLENAIEGSDPKNENVYVISFSYTLNI